MNAFEIFVPATSANLGPGFDCMGLALPFGSRFRVQVAPDGRSSYRMDGVESDLPPERNLFLVAAQRMADVLHAELPALDVAVQSEIPLARGLGSSASAVVAGLKAVDHLFSARWDQSDFLRLATELEGHPDNVAPAIYGGLCVAVGGREGPICAPLPLHEPPSLVVAIPEFELSTAKARAALPAVVSLQDAVYNVGRAALLTAALVSGWRECLPEALSDRLHQPYREALIPGMPQVVAAAKAAGAWGVTLSGAGPTLLAWCREDVREQVAEGMVAAWAGAGIAAYARAADISRRGMTIGPASGSARG